MTLEGKTALVTGSCHKGAGRSTALRLARDGANIVVNYGTHRSGKKPAADAKKVVAAIEEMGAKAIVCEADTRNDDQVAAMVQEAGKAFGGVDILVNNAGGGWAPCDWPDLEPDHVREVLDAELVGALITTRHVLARMRKQNWGRIVHIGMDHTPTMTQTHGLAVDYCMGKAGRAWMANVLGSMEAGNGITVNCVAPGPIGSMTMKNAVAAARGELDAWARRSAANCHDVAEIIAFLCSEAGRFVSSSIIQVGLPG